MKPTHRIFKEVITSVFGTLLMFAAIGMLIANRIKLFEIEFSWLEMVGTALLGYVFLMAKDSLIEGLFLNMFKIKKSNP
jgi:hypothetical protein